MIRLSLYIALALMLSACSRSVTPYKKVVGFIGEGCNDSVLVVIPSDGNGKKLLFNITDKTTYTKEHMLDHIRTEIVDSLIHYRGHYDNIGKFRRIEAYFSELSLKAGKV
jgi:hypothetical protein